VTGSERVTASGDVIGSERVGGLVGRSSNDKESVNEGEVTKLRGVKASGNVTGDNKVGGLIGSNGRGTVTDATASGNVNGKNSVGGLVGTNEAGVIQDATASGSVNGSTLVGGLVGENIRSSEFGSSDFFQPRIENVAAFGDVTGERDVGGLIGSNNGNGTIQSGFATGRVTGNNSPGGLVGTVESGSTPTITEAYWDTEATGQPTSAGSATGLTTAQMTGEAARTNMSELNFETAWTTTESYPQLRVLSSEQGTGGESTPDDPTQRVLQITEKSDPSELTQNDVTVVITRFNRGQSVNNIDIKQDDVTATITLFERS
jgi:hypothetical protein